MTYALKQRIYSLVHVNVVRDKARLDALRVWTHYVNSKRRANTTGAAQWMHGAIASSNYDTSNLSLSQRHNIMKMSHIDNSFTIWSKR